MRQARTVDGSAEPGVECNLGLEHFGDGTIPFRITGEARELVLADSGDLCAQRQSRTTDLEALRPVRLEGHGRLGCELGWFEAGGLQREREGHREASGVSRGDELFGVGALLVLKASLVGIGRTRQGLRVGGQVTIPVTASTMPDGLGFADHNIAPSYDGSEAGGSSLRTFRRESNATYTLVQSALRRTLI